MVGCTNMYTLVDKPGFERTGLDLCYSWTGQNCISAKSLHTATAGTRVSIWRLSWTLKYKYICQSMPTLYTAHEKPIYQKSFISYIRRLPTPEFKVMSAPTAHVEFVPRILTDSQTRRSPFDMSLKMTLKVARYKESYSCRNNAMN